MLGLYNYRHAVPNWPCTYSINQTEVVT